MCEVTRSPGTIVTIGNMPAIVGVGYRGLTNELDSVVAQAAELLRETFNQDVEIRFNSDRQSGGAWLVTPQRSDFWRNGEVCLGARLAAVLPEGMDIDRYIEMSRSERDALPRRIRIDTQITEEVMHDPSKIPADSYSHKEGREHPSLEVAIAYLREEVDTAKLNTTQPERKAP